LVFSYTRWVFYYLSFIFLLVSPCESLAMFPNTKIIIIIINVEEGAGGCGGGHESI
jgi:hypothetical protein